MDLLKKHLNKIIGGIVILIIITFVYNNFFGKKDGDFAESSELVVQDGEVDEISRKILRTLDVLNGLKIDVDFFKEDLSNGGNNLISFYDLVDFSKSDIAPKNIGKDNPLSANSEFYNKVYGGQDQGGIQDLEQGTGNGVGNVEQVN